MYVCNRRHDCMWPLSHGAELLECISVRTICTSHISDHNSCRHQGWQRGLWPGSASRLPSGLAARVMTRTCQPVTGSCWRALERMWLNHLVRGLMIRVWRYSVADFNIQLIQVIVSVDSISCALSLWYWCVCILFVFGQCLIGSIP